MSTIAFRRWRVSAAGELVGLGVPHVWTAGRQTATCRGIDGAGFGNCAPLRVWPGHPVPSMRSRCGIWAHRDPIAACECGDPTSPGHGAVGVVRLWGRYVEHQTGWRAQHAKVVALVDFTGRLLDHYDAPRYPDLPSMYGEWAPSAGWAVGEGAVWCDPDQALPSARSIVQQAAQLGADLRDTVERVRTVVLAEAGPLVDRLVRLATEDNQASAAPREPAGPDRRA